jgi:ABC-type Mn2+/Zn2+ transport system ATPase subunit
LSERPLLQVHGLRASYGAGPPALAGVGFAAEAGEMIAVLGPNGGGKTTLFRAVLGQVPSVAGRIERKGRIAYVPQTERPRLDFPVQVLDVALMGTYPSVPWYRRLGAAERRIAADALERVGIAERASDPYGELSGGQRQRVLIARALCQRADVLLLDEPLTGVDRPNTELILRLLRDLRGDGRAVLVATHDIEQARSFDRVLCLNREQVAFGPPAEILTGDVLAGTYGGELITLADGERAVVVQHHHHGDGR